MLTGILQPTHLIIILIVALLVLGPKRLPNAGRAVGEGLKEFKNSISAGHDDNHEIPACTNLSSQELTVVRSSGGLSSSSAPSSGTVGCCWPHATSTIEWTLGSPNAGEVCTRRDDVLAQQIRVN
jgi:sec-independent protein translocase protein TatA